MSRHRRTAGLLAGLAVLAGLALTSACGDDASRADEARDAAKAAGLNDDVADFFALATEGTDATFRVSYVTTGSDGMPVQITTTQRPPDRRIDFFQTDGTVDSTIITDGNRYRCLQTAGKWECAELPGGVEAPGDAFDPDVLQATINRLQQRADDYDFRLETRRLVNVDSSCLVTTVKAEKAADQTLGASGTLCLAADGAQLLVDTPRAKLEATAYASEPPEDAFDLPADPGATSEAPAPST